MRVCVLISGRGSNMEALIRGADNYVVEKVISNKPDAPGLRIAERLGVECVAETSLDGIRDILDGAGPDLICMAGFMRILPADITENHMVMNIHPALLPKYPGLRGVKQALDDGATYSGCTVHFADSGVDTGRIIAQDMVAVERDDTAKTLADRILEREHRLYVEAVRWCAGLPDASAMPGLLGGAGEAASAATEMGAAYIRRHGTRYAVGSEKPGTPTYVAAAPGDPPSLVYERIMRLAEPDRIP